MANNLAEYTLFSFMDAYSDYNQIPMFEYDRRKTTLMTKQSNYQYKVMLFGLKKAGVNY